MAQFGHLVLHSLYLVTNQIIPARRLLTFNCHGLQAVDRIDRQEALAKNKNIERQNLWHKRSTIIINHELAKGYDRNLNKL